VQSTAVDVSLMGFTTLLDTLPKSARPLFNLHDALIIDVMNKDLPDLLSLRTLTVPGYDQKFPVKVSLLEHDE
jgi:hypothetical protein